MDQNLLKKQAAEKAVSEIRPGMVLGLGSGSTMQFALEILGEKLRNKELHDIVGIPSSVNTEKEAKRLGIPLTTLNDECRKANKSKNKFEGVIDLTIDGADEVDEKLNLIKGGGGALLREKIIAQASKRFIVMVDETKLSKYLGEKFFVPVEVLKYSEAVEENFLMSLGAKTNIRKDSNGSVYNTDEDNIIIDARFDEIKNPEELSHKLDERAGIVEHGIFLSKFVEKVLCAGNNGVKIISK